MDYTITLTEAEQKAMEYITADVDDWITNAATNRARIAIDEICDLYVKHKLDNNQAIIVTNKPDMVLAAYEEGLVKTVVERNLEATTQSL
jgi:hypothetical protein